MIILIKNKLIDFKDLDPLRHRKTLISELVKQLILPNIQKRVQSFSKKSYVGVPSHLIESFKRCGVKILRENTLNEQTITRKRCKMCNNDNKVKTTCSACSIHVCNFHGPVIEKEFRLCFECSNPGLN